MAICIFLFTPTALPFPMAQNVGHYIEHAGQPTDLVHVGDLDLGTGKITRFQCICGNG